MGIPDGASAKRPPVDTVAGLARLCYRHPLFIIGALWPLVLLAPHFPGIPRPSISGLPWRQELGLSLLLTVALGLLIKRRQSEKIARIDRATLPVIFAFGTFRLLDAIFCRLGQRTLTQPSISVCSGASYLVFFFLMNSILRNPKLMRTSVIALAGVIWVLAIACAIESWFGAPLTDGNLRSDLKPILRGSGGFGEIMAMAAILFAALSLHANRRRRALALRRYGDDGLVGNASVTGARPFRRCPCRILPTDSRSGYREAGKSPTVGPLGLDRWRSRFDSLLPIAAVIERWAEHRTLSTVSRFTQDLSADVSTRVRFLFWGVGLEMARAHPLLGVGGNNYEVEYATARAQFSARHPNSSLVAMNEHLLTVYAHNEYVQLIAELGQSLDSCYSYYLASR